MIQTVIGKKYLEDFLGLPPEGAAWILSLMAVLAAISGFVPILFRRLTGGRIRVFITGAGAVSAFVCCGLTLMTGLGIKNPAAPVLLCLLSMTASLSPIAIPLLYGTNAPGRAGLAVCLFNFSLHFFVAVFSNAGGLVLGCFEPKYVGLTRVYGQDSWLAVFSMLSVFPFIVIWLSFRLAKDVKLD